MHDKQLRRLALIFTVIGLGVSLYLVWIKFTSNTALCMGVGDCEAVNTSIYSAIRGIPIALFGAGAYAAILVLLFLESRLALVKEWGPIAEFGMALSGTLYSAYLTYLEVAVLRKICPYCATSAIAITLICIIAGLRLKPTSTLH